jgi:transcriptional regulator with XRE-family HTH domain
VLEPIDVEELARRVRDERRRRQQSLRTAADEAGIPFNTFSRVERGFLPDLANYARLTTWLGIDPGTFFPNPIQRHEPDTTEQIRVHLHADPHLSDDAADQIASLVSKLYQTLATPSGDTEIHLRAHTTFAPEAARRLGELLEQLQAKIVADPTLGTKPGWHV